MTDAEFSKALERKGAIVSTWPEWKRNILKDCLVGVLPTPRRPVTPIVKAKAKS